MSRSRGPFPRVELDRHTIRRVRAELKSLDSADAPEGLADFKPDDPDKFGISVAAVVGPSGGTGGELFYFACSARWLIANPPEKGFAYMRGHLLVTRWDAALVHRAISDLCRRTEGRDWNEIATKLSRYGAWEFEDYREAE